MTAEAQLIGALRDWPGLFALVSGVFLNAADEDQQLPYLVVTATHDPELLIDGSVDLDHVTFTVACWGSGAAVAEALADEAGAFFRANDEYAVLARLGGFDEQTANDCAVITADLWIQF